NRDTPYAILQDPINPNLIYLGTNRGLFRSLDRGASFSQIVGAKGPVRRSAPVKRPPVRGKTPVKKTVSVEPVSAAPKLIPTLT
ncbi:hypothetical protein OFB80_32550, partial [Escherichia coli]|nr:hypothetical protein [Escherichia coli]